VNWIEGLLILGLFLGLFSGAFLIARSPAFWVGLGTVIFKALLPFITKRMLPEEEAAWRKCMLQGREWDHRKKKCK
jgi:hypothetical protein